MNFSDNILNKDFKIETNNIAQLKNSLSNLYLSEKGIDVTEMHNFIVPDLYKYRYQRLEKDFTIDFEPENYIFQPIVLLENNNGTRQLLDGFRRLFRTNDIDENANCICYIFKQEDFTEIELLYLLITLNQPKFNGSNGSFIERGVSLYFKFNYNIDINLLGSIFYQYIVCDDTELIASLYESMNILKEKILEPNFISNLKLLNDIYYKYPNLKYIPQIGSFIYNLTKETGKSYSIEQINFSPKFEELYNLDNYDVIGSREVNNGIVLMQEFVNSIKESIGMVVDKTYNHAIEKFNESKKEVLKKKMKTVTLSTGRNNSIKDFIEAGKKIKIRCLLKPYKTNESYNDELVHDFIIDAVEYYSKSFYPHYVQKEVTPNTNLFDVVNSKFDSVVSCDYMFNQDIQIGKNRYKAYTYFNGYTEEEIKIIG